MRDEKVIQVIIPTYNSARDLDATMESIRKQNYIPERICVTIVDFGSSDGTYEKALGYNWKNLGVYTRPFQKRWRSRISDIARMLGIADYNMYQYYFIVLYPGDVMYPNCCSMLSYKFKENYRLNPEMVFCESDIFDSNGNIEKQKPLFSHDCVIDGEKDICEYIKRGYKHQIFSMTQSFYMARDVECYERNEGRCWNKLVHRNCGKMAVYIEKPLVCTKRIIYEDELEEILHIWENFLALEQCTKWNMDKNFIPYASENLSEYALWRSFCLYQSGTDEKAMQDCFMISRVISPGIEEREIYQKMKQLVLEGDIQQEKIVEQYFREQN